MLTLIFAIAKVRRIFVSESTGHDAHSLLTAGRHKKIQMLNIILEIAKQNPYGFTYNLNTKTFVKFGICVAYNATQNSFDEAGAASAIAHALNHCGIIGGWFNSENGRYYFDSVRIFRDRNEAIAFGLAEKQIAIFDLTNLNEIKL